MYRSALRVPPGGRSFNVHLHTVASATVPVVLTAEQLAEIAEEYGVAVADLTIDQLHETLVDEATDNTPRLCHKCTGGIFTTSPSLELGDEWDPDSEGPRAVERGQDIAETTLKDGD